jgi:succinoglycan biosynthesis protein ExoM
MSTHSAPLRVTVAVLTFRRPSELASCLAAVAAHLDGARLSAGGRGVILSLLVVDNDAHASARCIVDDLADRLPLSISYVVEPHPGIAAARDRALEEAGRSDLLVFLDDDERPSESWIQPLLDTWAATGAAAVMGRVVSVFGSPLDPWVSAGEFFRRRSMPTGSRITVGAAGNLLLDLATVRRLGIRFDRRLALGAGEDSLFTQQLARSGAAVVWCEESVVTDHVPPQRTTRRWVLQRARSHGNTETVVALLLARSPGRRAAVRLAAAMRGGVRVAAGAARVALGLASGSLRHQARGHRTAQRGLGIAAGALGHALQEYARADAPTRVREHARG